MKIRYLLLGLMICVAGAGTINSSDGSFCGQNATPFLIFGHVCYEDGSPCNSPVVNITNADAAWCADTVSGSAYYQTLLCAANVSAGDVLRWSATDGTVFDTTNRTVGQGDLESGGIFDFDMILQSIAPRITGYAPESQIHDIENATRRFNITLDQVVDVTWLINGSPVHTNESVTDAAYTHTNVAIGVWNVSANASNENGTAMQEWIWCVNPPSPPPLDGSVTAASSDSNVRQPVIIYGWILYKNSSRCIGPLVNISNLNTGMQWQAQTHPDHYYYQLVIDSANVSAEDMVLIDASKNGTSVGGVTHTVNQSEIEQGAIEVDINKRYLPDFTVTNLTFDPPDQLMIGDIAEINATIANSGGGGDVFVEFCDNKSITIERVLNDHPESPINDTITLPDVKRIRVHFDSFDVSSVGNITICDETRLVEWLNGTGTGYWTEWCDGSTIRIESWNAGFTVDRYEAVLADECKSLGAGNSTNISAVWNLSDQSMGWAVHGSHNITVRVNPYDRVVESDEANNERIEAVYVNPSLDFAVTEISLNQTEPVLGDVVEVSANVSNYGVRNGTTVMGVFYDNRSIEIVREIQRTIKQLEGENYVSTDNISLPSGVLGVRLHFNSLNVLNGHVDICDNNGRVVERIEVNKNNHWTDCIYTDNITVRAVLPYNPSQGTYRCNFNIDRYEALIAEEPVTLNVTESKIINASWLTGAAYGGAREHDITVMVDPRNHSVETNETNNTGSKGIIVNGTDLTVTEIEIPGGSSDNPCYMGQDVDVTATIANVGAVDATNFTVEFLDGSCDNCSDMNTSGVIFNETHIERLNSGENMTISVIWNPAEINYHTITARIPYEATDSNETNNELSDCSDVEARYDFSVEDVNIDPQTAEKGESVDITATIGNSNISHAGGNVSIAFFVNSTDFAGTLGERFTRIGTIDDVHLEVNETKTVSMSWDVDVVGGCHTIAAVVNPDNELEEINPPGGTKDLPYSTTIRFRGSNIGNNVKSCTLHVIPLDLNITDIMLDPAEPIIGDLVNVSATIINNGGAKANSTAWFYMQSNESIYRKSSWGEPQSWSSALQPEVPIRFHFDYIRIQKINKAGKVNASVTDKQGQHHPVCFYVKYGEGYDAKTSKIDYDTHGYVVDGGRRWNDVWTDWTNGTAIEINAISECDTTGYLTEVELSIDKYQLRLGNRTVTLSAGESGLYNAEWNTSLPLKPGKNYTILANVENQRKKSNVTRLGGTDLTITNLSVKPVVWDGEAVWINATIENLGRMDATDFRVNFTEVYYPTYHSHPETGWTITARYPHPESINTTHIEGLGSGNSTNISVLWDASIREIECTGKCERRNCEWIEIADDYNISVEIYTNPDLEEDDSTNQSLQQKVHVNPSRDFNVTSLSFSVNVTARDPLELDLYDDVNLNATVNITNLMGVGSVDVGFYIDEVSDEHKIGSYGITFDGGNGTGYAEIGWSIACPPGDHNIIVVADPEGKIQEISETNNILTQKIFVNAPELVLESLDVHPKNPKRGETVSINVTITNVGGKNTSDVTLCIYDWAERQIENLCEQSGPGREEIVITRENATAMKLYLDLEVGDGCKVCINDGSGNGIICYDKNFHGWTPWMFDSSTTIVVTNTETEIASARVGKLYYIVPSSIIDTSVHNLGINETKNVTVDWSTSIVGERFIAAIVDPEDYVTEYNESNNRLAEFISVQTADLIVSDLSLWLNDTEVGEDDTIKHGDNVTITTDIANTGVEGAGNFSVRFLIDDIPIEEETIPGLADGSTIPLVTNWSATVGHHLIKVEADWESEIDETNETNNILAWERNVSGAELSGDISWETLGLHGEILFGPTEPYDEDEVVITATINNSGAMPAANFSAAIFFDCTPYSFQKRCRHSWPGGNWTNITYPDAEYIYLNVTTPVYVTDGRCMIKDDVIVYDENGSEVARPHKSCSVLVNGGTVNVNITPQGYSSEPVFDIHFYPIYQNGTSMLFDGIDVPANSSYNISMNRTVSVGDFTIMAVIDPENKAPEDEDHKEDNILSGTMSVKPTRDFTVTNVTAGCTNLSDLDTTEITAGVSNIGLRNGTTDVSFVDCEGESRTYKYHFDADRSLSYLPIPPDATLSGLQYHGYVTQDYENLMMIHRPGVDAIELHLKEINLDSPSVSDKRQGVISVRDENETEVWIETYISKGKSYADIRVPGETTYIYTCRASFVLDGYTTEKELLIEEVRLNSTKDMNESKNITSRWNAYTGDHIIAVTLDGDDRITETNESNNKLSPLFHVNASRDPAIVELNITPEHPEDGDDVDISAIIANNGLRNASFTFDLWVNTTRNEGGTDEYLPDANLITELGDRIRYIKLLKHANLTLAPGENVTVNATWNDISVFGSPIHRIIAIVDPLDEIDEMNESNNEIEKEIIMAYPDLTVGGAYVYVHGETGKPVVNIKEIGGISGASDVTVRFESYETEEYIMTRCGCIRHPGASNMQVYFDHIDARGKNKNAYVEVGGKRYSGREFSDVWSPWVEGDLIRIKCRGGGTSVYISEYRWGNVSDEQIDYLGSLDSERVEMPWEYEYPLNVNVTVDPDNNITELNEDNNNETLLMYADLRADKISFVGSSDSPSSDKLSLDAEKFKIDGYITNGGGGGGNDIVFPVSDFNVTLEFRNRYPNGTVGDLVFNMTKYIEDSLCAGKEMPIRFEFDPSEELEVGGNYTVFLIADSSGDICESDELLYPEGEDNNFTSKEVYVYNTSGYTGGGELINVAEGEVNGRVVYTIGDEHHREYRGMSGVDTDSGVEKTVRYTGVVPDDAGGIEFARIFVYWFTWEYEGGRLVPVLAGMDATFNGHSLTMAGNYSDNPGATMFDAGYGLYSYDVTDYVTKGENEATVRITSTWRVGIHAIGLLVVYEDEDEPLTKYWVNEGADIVMAGNGAFPTGLPSGDCITTATFDDVERDDIENVNATLLTVLGFYAAYGIPSDDALEFNGQSIGSRIHSRGMGGYWESHYRDTGIALTKNKWEDVTDDLERGDNLAEIHSKGNYMMPNNAFLRLIFPPDLNVINLTAPASTVVGAHHSINVTIRNDGRSDARDFNATLEIDGRQMVRIPNLDLAAGKNMTIHLYNWTPMMLARVYNLTAAADVLSGEDWTEIETDNNALTKYVMIEEGGFGNQTGPRGTGGGSKPTGGEYTEKITGRVMQGVKDFLSGGGGGGAGMFSLTEWIMKGAVWLVLLLFVYAGYRMEQRSYRRVRVGLRQPY